MSIWESLAVFAAGIGAGTINTIVGSGTLITFPVLLATGLPPVTANVSNTLGLVPGSISGAIGYRKELQGQRSRIIRLGAVSLVGGLAGAILLLTLPSDSFDTIVPVLIGLALVLVVFQPKLAAALRRRQEAAGGDTGHPDGGPCCCRACCSPARTGATSAPPKACSTSASWACCSARTSSGSTR